MTTTDSLWIGDIGDVTCLKGDHKFFLMNLKYPLAKSQILRFYEDTKLEKLFFNQKKAPYFQQRSSRKLLKYLSKQALINQDTEDEFI